MVFRQYLGKSLIQLFYRGLLVSMCACSIYNGPFQHIGPNTSMVEHAVLQVQPIKTHVTI